MEGDGLGFLDEWAGEWGDDGASRVGHGLSVFGVRPTQDVPGILNDGVLEATAGPEKGTALLARETDGAECTLHAAVGTARHAPKSIKPTHARFIPDLLSGNPFVTNRNGHGLSGQIKGAGNRPMG